MLRKLSIGLAAITATLLWSVALAGAKPDVHDKRLDALRRTGMPALEKLTEEIRTDYEAMLGRDVGKSKKAIDSLLKRGAVEVVCVALKHPFPEVSSYATDRLGPSRDHRALPALLNALHSYTSTVMGGKGVLASQRESARRTLNAMGTILGKDFGKIDLSDAEQTLVLVKALTWMVEAVVHKVPPASPKERVEPNCTLVTTGKSLQCRFVKCDEKTVTVFLIDKRTSMTLDWKNVKSLTKLARASARGVVTWESLSGVDKSAAFQATLNWLKSVKPAQVRTAWFLHGKPSIAMVCTADLQKYEVATAREVFNHATQSQKTRKLSHVQVMKLKGMLEGMPRSTEKTELKSLVVVSFMKDKTTTFYAYDRGTLPPRMNRLFDLTGAYVETGKGIE